MLNALQHPDYSHRIHYEPSHLRFDTLFSGVFLSYLHNFRPEILQRLMSNPWRLPVTMVSILALAPVIFLPSTDPIVYTVGFTLVYIGFGTMLLLSLYQEDRKRPQPGIALRAIGSMGTYSYTLYLWHVPLAQAFAGLASRFPSVNPYLLHAIYFMTSIVTGVVLSKLVEIPVLRLRERLFPPLERKPAGQSSVPHSVTDLQPQS
jgi:peptidoglycan/LPS O-acetylase OafA/YrhL